MGEVWAATHRDTGRPVAVKIITDRGARDDRFQAAFRAEVRAAARLRHPGIVRVFDHGVVEVGAAEHGRRVLTPGCPYLVMERVDGGTLREPAAGDLALDWRRIRTLLLDLLDALAHAHARGVVHRDLKPDNVLLGPGGGIKLTDFGVAHAMDRDEELARNSEVQGQTVGTPAYMAPEQIRGHWREQGPWTDLYALGCMAFELVHGTPPFRRTQPVATVVAHLTEPVPALTPRMTIPTAFERWIRRLLMKRPAERFQRAADAAWSLSTMPVEPGDGPASTSAWATASVEVSDEVLARIRAAETLGPDGPGGPDDLLGAHALPPLDEASAEPTLAVVLKGHAEAFGPAGFEEAAEHGADPEAAAAGVRGASTELTPLESDERIPGAPPIPFTWASNPAQEPEDVGGIGGLGLSLFGLCEPPLVGRSAEQSWMWRVLCDADAAGGPQVIVLRGPAGYGKSRLARWFAERAHELGAGLVLHAAHAERPGVRDGVGGLVARWARIAGLDREATVKRLRSRCTDIGLRSEDDALALAELVVPADERAARSTGLVRFQNPAEARAALIRWLRALTDERPVVAWMEDAQWGRRALELGHALLDRAEADAEERPGRVVLLLTVRDEALIERPVERERLDALVSRPGVHTVEVGPLAVPHREPMVEALLPLTPGAARRLARASAGNPLLAIQRLTDWAHRGLLESTPAGYELTAAALDELARPQDVDRVWAGRAARLLDGLPYHAARALELAALLGLEPDPEEWTRACAAAGLAPAHDAVELMFDQSLARATGERPDAWAFAHPGLRAAIEAETRRAGRDPELHLACARALAPDADTPTTRTPRGVAERLGRHLLAACRVSEAVRPLLDAAQEHVDAGNYEDARALADQVDSALDSMTAPGGAAVRTTGAARSEAMLIRASVALFTGAVDRATEQASQVQRWTDSAGDGPDTQPIRARAALLFGRLTNEHGEYAQAEAWLAEADRRAAAAGRADLRAAAQEHRGAALLRLGLFDQAEDALAAADAAYDDAGDLAGRGRVGYHRARVAARSGRHDSARRRLADAAGWFEGAGIQGGRASCDNQLGEIARHEGDLDGALLHYRRALDRWTRIGAANAVFARANLALVLLERGAFAEAAPLLRQTLAQFERAGRHAAAAIARASLLPCAAHAGDLAEVDAHLDALDALWDRTGMKDTDVARMARRAAEMLEAAGALDRARRARAVATRQATRPEA
jgi:serine/threonine protein kinase/tetratricopeptide (TPR) repeat protein